jgi:predicted ATPase
MVELKRIELKGLKSIREMGLELRDMNVLIGANGSGKSNFVSFFTLVSELVRRNLQLYVAKAGGADALLHFGARTTEGIFCHLQFAGGGYTFGLMPSTQDRLLFSGESWSLASGETVNISYTEAEDVGYSETALDDSLPKQDETAAPIIENLKSWRVHHFHDTSESARMKMTCDIHDNVSLRADGANLSSVLYLLRVKHESHYRLIVDTIRMVAPFFDDFDLHPSQFNEDKIRLRWRERSTDASSGPEALSDGTLRFICLTTLLLQPEPPPLIIIDEPELGLHPAAITLVASMLRGVATRAQVIACTQSVTFVNQFEPAEIIVVDREEGQSVFRRLTEEQVKGWLDEYALGDLWEKNIIGGRP